MKIGVRAALAGLMAAVIPFAAAAGPAPKRSIAGDIEGVALGVFLGQPTGLTCRLGLGGPGSLEAKAAWDLAGSKDSSAALTFQANYLLEFPGVLVIEGRDIPPYVGGGAQFDIGAESRIGLRLPFGLAYRLEKAPIEFCLELGIGMSLFPSTRLMTSGGLGVRYIIRGRK